MIGLKHPFLRGINQLFDNFYGGSMFSKKKIGWGGGYDYCQGFSGVFANLSYNFNYNIVKS